MYSEMPLLAAGRPGRGQRAVARQEMGSSVLVGLGVDLLMRGSEAGSGLSKQVAEEVLLECSPVPLGLCLGPQVLKQEALGHEVFKQGIQRPEIQNSGRKPLEQRGHGP